jgi:hypothetical protein
MAERLVRRRTSGFRVINLTYSPPDSERCHRSSLCLADAFVSSDGKLTRHNTKHIIDWGDQLCTTVASRQTPRCSGRHPGDLASTLAPGVEHHGSARYLSRLAPLCSNAVDAT